MHQPFSFSVFWEHALKLDYIFLKHLFRGLGAAKHSHIAAICLTDTQTQTPQTKVASSPNKRRSEALYILCLKRTVTQALSRRCFCRGRREVAVVPIRLFLQQTHAVLFISSHSKASPLWTREHLIWAALSPHRHRCSYQAIASLFLSRRQAGERRSTKGAGINHGFCYSNSEGCRWRGWLL